MHAAVVTAFDTPPRYQEFALPVPLADQELLEVVAAGLHPRVRSQSNGTHYTSTEQLPLIPGIDGVGRRSDGSLVYFVLPDTALGSMADRALIDPRRSIPLPSDVDPVLIAAAMNPGMSSWVALQKRVVLQPGQSVLVMGAAGSAGRLAIQVARHLGAGRVVAAARGAEKLAALTDLGADALIDLAGDPDDVAGELAANATEVDIVLDYLWGPPAQAAILPLLTAREDRSRLLSWVQIGAVAGGDIRLPSAALRQANVHFLGSGQGSVSTRGILETLPSLAAAVGSGEFDVEAVARPLAEVERAWGEAAGSARVVLVP